MADEIVSRKDVGAYLGKGALGIATGVGLFTLNALGGFSVLGFQLIPIAVGALIAWAGWNAMAKNKGALGSLIAMGAGALTILSGIPLIGGLGGFFLGAGAIGSLIFGGINLFKGIKGFQSRS